ncbi:MAG: hypothetical protein RJB22_1132, partial [Pseudomonadota bacterium]
RLVGALCGKARGRGDRAVMGIDHA